MTSKPAAPKARAHACVLAGGAARALVVVVSMRTMQVIVTPSSRSPAQGLPTLH